MFYSLMILPFFKRGMLGVCLGESVLLQLGCFNWANGCPFVKFSIVLAQAPCYQQRMLEVEVHCTITVLKRACYPEQVLVPVPGFVLHDHTIYASSDLKYLLEQCIPIEKGHHISFHMVHGYPLLTLVNGKGLQRLSIIVKLCQNDLVIACYQRAGSISIILEGRIHHLCSSE